MEAGGAEFRVCLPEHGPDFAAVACAAGATGAELAAAAGDAFALSAACRLTLELRNAGPLRPADGGSDALWAAAAPVGDADVPPPGFFVGRTHAFRAPARPPPPPPAARRAYPPLDAPHVWVLLPEQGVNCVGVPLGRAVDGAGLKDAVGRAFSLPAERRGTLELRLAGPLWPNEGFKALRSPVWDALPTIEDQDRVPDRERGLVVGCYILGRTSKYYHKQGLPVPAVGARGGREGALWSVLDAGRSLAGSVAAWLPLSGLDKVPKA
ncbi:hypothetical protein DFJ74DRAFT_648692 [Hyaloraphidium curvatum]|nr:hypothetical protein DFJ74DRAFT_648692 [Hyaloraphidium curvatum]